MIARRGGRALARLISSRWLAAAIVLALLAGCAGPQGAPARQPTATPIPWRPPAGPVTLNNVTRFGLLGLTLRPTGTTYHMDFTDDGRYLLTVSGDGAVRAWDTRIGDLVWQKEDANPQRAFFAMGDSQIVVIERDQDVAIYALDSALPLRVFPGYTATIGPAAISPDGRLLALGAVDGTMIVWDLVSDEQLYTVRAHASPVRGVFFSPDGALLATVSDEPVVRLWDVQTGETRAVLADFEGPPQMVAFSPDSARAAVNFRSGVRVWSTRDGALLRAIQTAPGVANRAIAFAGMNYLVGAGGPDTVSMWDLDTGDLFASLPGHDDNFHSMAVDPTGTLLVTVARPGHAYLWNMANPNQRVEIGAQDQQLSLPAWSPDGSVLALAASSGAIYFWGIPGEPLPAPAPGD